jgi:LmbE family N-acetylglucosaminyl deacetylase
MVGDFSHQTAWRTTPRSVVDRAPPTSPNMLEFHLETPPSRGPRVLCIGAHSDDIEIGCGGTIIELLRRHRDAEVHWVVLSAGPRRDQEARRAAHLLLRGAMRRRVTLKDFSVSYFPSQLPTIKDYFEELKAIEPDVIFAHSRDDLHQDHRVVGELTWNTFRDHVILEYEIPKYDGGLGSPSVFVPLSTRTVRRKVEVLMDVYETQRTKPWFTPSTFEGLMRLRGVECNSTSGYAEAFYSRKLVFAV